MIVTLICLPSPKLWRFKPNRPDACFLHVCSYCVAETIESVCGKGCLLRDFGIMTDYPIIPRPDCLPELVAALTTTHAASVVTAMDAGVSFGLTVMGLPSAAAVADIFVPTSERSHGAVVYRGIGGGETMYRCNGSAAWAIVLADGNVSEHCVGRLRLDVQLLQARSDEAPDAIGTATF